MILFYQAIFWGLAAGVLLGVCEIAKSIYDIFREPCGETHYAAAGRTLCGMDSAAAAIAPSGEAASCAACVRAADAALAAHLRGACALCGAWWRGEGCAGERSGAGECAACGAEREHSEACACGATCALDAAIRQRNAALVEALKERLCEDCGADISGRGPQARRCADCAEARPAASRFGARAAELRRRRLARRIPPAEGGR